MYLRRATQKRKDGSTLTHLQIAENSWDPQRQRSKVKILLNCGREENAEVTERLHRLARSILRRCAPEQIVQENPEWKFINAWDFGDVHVLEQLWERIGIPQVLKKVLGKRRLAFAVERALFACQSGLCPCIQTGVLYAVVGTRCANSGNAVFAVTPSVPGNGCVGRASGGTGGSDLLPYF